MRADLLRLLQALMDGEKASTGDLLEACHFTTLANCSTDLGILVAMDCVEADADMFRITAFGRQAVAYAEGDVKPRTPAESTEDKKWVPEQTIVIDDGLTHHSSLDGGLLSPRIIVEGHWEKAKKRFEVPSSRAVIMRQIEEEKRLRGESDEIDPMDLFR